MNKKIVFYFVLLLTLQPIFGFGQNSSIKIPKFNDKYSNYVQQLENGKTDINYVDFRNSFLKSKQYSKKDIVSFNDLKKQVYKAINDRNYKQVIKFTKEMLSIDYTSMFAHKYLQQTYKILGDTADYQKYHDIEFGLLKSIISSGDGKTCETGWHVTQIDEEYFILHMIGAELQQQSVVSSGQNTCDKMVVKTSDGKISTYYFEANKVFEMESKMFGK